MAKPRDVVKERYWRDVFRRQAASGLGVRQFCVKEGLPEHRFHWWRRTLRQRGSQNQSGVGGNRRRRDSRPRDSQAAREPGPIRRGPIRPERDPSKATIGNRAVQCGSLEDQSPFVPVSLPLSLGSSIEVFNCHHRRSGHLYQGRFKAHLVEADSRQPE
ncbi:MAG: hypothetical protein GXX96_37505 [Planctomycetaceae bacterium]|nr:hypothetical protein [Planctomycetaceae bacterium]